jgi:predicted DNA-binding protein
MTKKTTLFSFRVSHDEADRLKQISERTGMRYSEILRSLLAHAEVEQAYIVKSSGALRTERHVV